MVLLKKNTQFLIFRAFVRETFEVLPSLMQKISCCLFMSKVEIRGLSRFIHLTQLRGGRDGQNLLQIYPEAVGSGRLECFNEKSPLCPASERRGRRLVPAYSSSFFSYFTPNKNFHRREGQTIILDKKKRDGSSLTKREEFHVQQG